MLRYVPFFLMIGCEEAAQNLVISEPAVLVPDVIAGPDEEPAADTGNEVVSEVCAFGEVYGDLFNNPRFALSETRRVTDVNTLSPLEAAQVLAAVLESSHEPTTAAEALEMVDQGEILVSGWWDKNNARAFTTYEYGAGDNSYGAVFEFGTTTIAASIHDGDLLDCVVGQGPAPVPCTSSCEAPATCVGASAEDGVPGECVDLGAWVPDGDVCHTQADCDLSVGQICAGLTTRDTGTCIQAWKQTLVVVDSSSVIPDGDEFGVAVPLPVGGIGSRSSDVWLSLIVSHDDTSELEINLFAADGSVANIWDFGTGEIYFKRRVFVMPSVGYANGLWNLTATDWAVENTGSVENMVLRVNSLDD